MKLGLVRKLARRFAIGVGLLVIAFLAFILEENVRGRILLARYKAELRAKGEKLTLAELNFVPRLEEGSSNAELAEAGRELSAVGENSRFNVSFVTTHLRWVAPGRVIVRSRQADLGVIRQPLPEKRGRQRNRSEPGRKTAETNLVGYASWGDLGDGVSAASNALARVKAALTDGEVFFPDSSQGSKPLLLGSLEAESVRNWLALEGLFKLHDGKLDGAIENVLLLAALAPVRRDEQFVYGSYRRLKTGEIGLDLTWEALQLPGWTDSQLSQLQTAWKMDGILPNMIAALETERSREVAFYDKVRSSFGEWQKLRRGLFAGNENTIYYMEGSLRVALWRAAWMDLSEVALLKKYQSLLEAARKVADGQAWQDVYRPPTGVDRPRYGLLNGAFWYAEDAVRRAMQFETRRKMTLTSIALKRFELRDGRLPNDLRSLVPEFLTELPRDFMTDQPLRYRINANGAFTLYSVGNDGRDDGGDPHPLERRTATNIWDGRDAFWPQPAQIDAGKSGQ